MLYPMRCGTCKRELDVGCPAKDYDSIIKPGIKCEYNKCTGTLFRFFTPVRTIINRSPFPGKGNEVAIPTNHGEDMSFRDKSEARDWLGERGLMSKWIENDM